MDNPVFNFESLVATISNVDQRLQRQATKAINSALTLRNWLIGLYIAEFELHGSDRATYGDGLLDALALELKRSGVSNTGRRQLYNYLAFYRAYPEIVRTVPAQSQLLLPAVPELQEIVRTPPAQLSIPPETLLSQLSWYR